MKQIKISKLNEQAKLPTRKNPTDAGMDLYSDKDVDIPLSFSEVIPTGVTIEIPPNYCGLIWAKSRNNHLIGAGVVDSGYQGEVLVKIFNTAESWLRIKKGDAIAQLLIQKIETPTIVEVSSEEIHQVKSKRGKTGGILTQYSQLEFTEELPNDFKLGTGDLKE